MLDWLKEILGEAYTEEIDKKVSDEIGKGFVARSDFNNVNDTKKGLEQQLADANKAITDMKANAGDAEKTAQAVADWEKKYNEDTANLKAELEGTKYTHGIESLVSKEKFSSEAARKAFIADLAAKKLPMEDGKLIGYDDFKKSYQETDPGAFAKDPETPPPYAAGTGKAPMWGKETDISKLGYSDRVKLKKENPELYKQLTNKEE